MKTSCVECEDDSKELECINMANELILSCNLPIPRMKQLRSIDAYFFQMVFKTISGICLSTNDLETKDDEVEALQTLIDVLSNEILCTPLTHIIAIDIVEHNPSTLYNLLEILTNYRAVVDSSQPCNNNCNIREPSVREDSIVSSSLSSVSDYSTTDACPNQVDPTHTIPKQLYHSTESSSNCSNREETCLCDNSQNLNCYDADENGSGSCQSSEDTYQTLMNQYKCNEPLDCVDKRLIDGIALVRKNALEELEQRCHFVPSPLFCADDDEPCDKVEEIKPTKEEKLVRKYKSKHKCSNTKKKELLFDSHLINAGFPPWEKKEKTFRIRDKPQHGKYKTGYQLDRSQTQPKTVYTSESSSSQNSISSCRPSSKKIRFRPEQCPSQYPLSSDSATHESPASTPEKESFSSCPFSGGSSTPNQELSNDTLSPCPFSSDDTMNNELDDPKAKTPSSMPVSDGLTMVDCQRSPVHSILKKSPCARRQRSRNQSAPCHPREPSPYIPAGNTQPSQPIAGVCLPTTKEIKGYMKQNMCNKVLPIAGQNQKLSFMTDAMEQTYRCLCKNFAQKAKPRICIPIVNKSVLFPRWKKLGCTPNKKMKSCCKEFCPKNCVEDENPDYLGELKKDFPFMNVSKNTLNLLNQLNEQQLRLACSQLQGILTLKDPTEKQCEELLEKQKRLADLMQKDMCTNMRLRNLEDERQRKQTIDSTLQACRQQTAHFKKYYNDYYGDFKKKLKSKQNQGEMLMYNLFKDGCKVQKENLQSLRQQIKENKSGEARSNKIYLDALDNFYKTRCDLMTENLTKERDKLITQGKAQRQALDTMKRQFRVNMEKNIQTMQEKIDQDQFHFRVADAKRYKTKLHSQKLC